jgi:hypothetical protein
MGHADASTTEICAHYAPDPTGGAASARAAFGDALRPRGDQLPMPLRGNGSGRPGSLASMEPVRLAAGRLDERQVPRQMNQGDDRPPGESPPREKLRAAESAGQRRSCTERVPHIADLGAIYARSLTLIESRK